MASAGATGGATALSGALQGAKAAGGLSPFDLGNKRAFIQQLLCCFDQQ
jgi:hypothetical protein